MTNEEITKQAQYNNAIRALKSSDLNEVKNAKYVFEQLGEWYDAPSKISECDALIEKLTNKYQKKDVFIKLAIAIITLVVFAIIIWVAFLIQDESEYLADVALNTFIANDQASFEDSLNNGILNDIKMMNITMRYDKDDYSKANKTLNCVLEYELYSNEISDYYTNEANSASAKKLADALATIYPRVKEKKYTYKTRQGETIIVKAFKPNGWVKVRASDNRLYALDVETGTTSIGPNTVFYGTEKTVTKEETTKEETTKEEAKPKTANNQENKTGTHICIVDGCYKTATVKFNGTSGIEWYCDEHYKEMEDFAEELLKAADYYQTDTHSSHKCAICGKDAPYEDPYDEGTWYCLDDYTDAIEWYLNH